VARYKPLAEKDEVPRRLYDDVVATTLATAAKVDSASENAAAARHSVELQIDFDSGVVVAILGQFTTSSLNAV
jgi:F0F1-type ATP synthase assembly protein I